MIKVLYLLITILPLIVFTPSPEEAARMNDFQWAAFIMWTVVMLMVAFVGVIAFKSVWLRDGFAGINKILEDHEAIRFLASVMSFFFLEVYIGLHASEFSGAYPHAEFKYWLSFSGCVGTGGYAVFDKIIKSRMGDKLIDAFKKNKE
jgi:hypothetical protein